MPSILYILVPFFLASILAVLRTRSKHKSVQNVRGPPRPSFLLGHEWMMRHREHFGGLEMQWLREYGPVYRIGGCFGQDVLVLSDPRALQYVLHTSGYRFPRAPDVQRLAEALLGPGLGTVDGITHQRQRKIMNPAFSASQLRQFLPLIQSFTSRLIDKLKNEIRDDAAGTRVVDVLQWTSKVGLDIIGITAFRYHFHALEGEKSASVLRDALRNIFSEGSSSLSRLDILYVSLWRMLPDFVLRILDLVPARDLVRPLRFRNFSQRIARDIFQKQVDIIANDMNTAERDIVNVLALSYLTEEPSKRMSDEEIYSQLSTFTLAGHDTTATTTAWILYELSYHPHIQAQICEEILQAREHCQGDLTSNDYDSMALLDAVIKVRNPSHSPFCYHAAQDDVIPLSEPTIALDGSVMSDIPIPKGQIIVASLYTYNRLSSVWGHDADVWNPDRFLNPSQSKQMSLGVYANLMTFGAGIRACIGWRFVIMEMQSVITELLSSFEFSPSEEGLELQHAPGTLTLSPVVKGRAHEGEQVPLRVALCSKE
ncbi:cytochrome P450 [Desarmillaria tabescens]|uniref:Cytochrome P450 n=1 Tax=Armillaria tabescens TaxID=1929756 RepID=A0AA39J8V8_ARMTA|nr:cytochrome P450 [Desarmillaria tabescens]KAK0438188.1 cytochrome P450 [Desarmillaria tabescens]